MIDFPMRLCEERVVRDQYFRPMDSISFGWGWPIPLVKEIWFPWFVGDCRYDDRGRIAPFDAPLTAGCEEYHLRVGRGQLLGSRAAWLLSFVRPKAKHIPQVMSNASWEVATSWVKP